MADPVSSIAKAFNPSTGLAQLLDSPIFNITSTSEFAKLGLFIVIVLVSAKVVTIIVNKIIERTLTQGKAIDKRLKVDQFKLKTTQKIFRYFVWLTAVIIILQNLGIEVTALIAALGIGGIAVAFGAQETVANIIAGFVLMADKPFKIGDRIALGPKGGGVDQNLMLGGDNVGDIIDIGLRSTKLKTNNNAIVIIPNAEFTKRDIWNVTSLDPKIRLVLNVQIAYESNHKLAEKVLLELAKNNPRVMQEPKPDVLFRGFEENGVKMSLRAWIKDVRDSQQMTSALYDAIKTEFDANGIEIPYPKRQIVYDREYRQEMIGKRKQTRFNSKEETKTAEQ
ncbi:MAG: mechanosensitive ion channel family protein [archaeon]|nr:mechanosensitive ion channel family protein [archaeon]